MHREHFSVTTLGLLSNAARLPSHIQYLPDYLPSRLQPEVNAPKLLNCNQTSSQGPLEYGTTFSSKNSMSTLPQQPLPTWAALLHVRPSPLPQPHHQHCCSPHTHTCTCTHTHPAPIPLPLGKTSIPEPVPVGALTHPRSLTQAPLASPSSSRDLLMLRAQALDYVLTHRSPVRFLMPLDYHASSLRTMSLMTANQPNSKHDNR